MDPRQLEQPTRTAISNVKRGIMAFVLKHPGCTFAELVKEVPGCAGPFAVGSAFSNLILWRGVSMEAVQALATLERTRSIRFEATTVHPYGQSGREVRLPYAMKLQDYDAPHWLPVLIHARRLPLKTR
jgi:hypothetical protein